MSLIFMDGFDHYTTADLLEKWSIRGGTFEILGSSYGRFGSNGVSLYGTSGYLRKVILGSNSTIYFGGAFYKASPGATSASTGGMFAAFDESSVAQVVVRVNPSYGFSVYRGATLLGSSSAGLVTDQKWHYLEVKVTISDTVGVVEVKLDGSQIINLTSQDTRNGSEYIGYVQISGEIVNKYFYWDDIYIDDSQFHGDCRIRTFMPTSNGYTNFTPSTGSNYENVDETAPDEDTTYNEASNDGDKDSYGITPITNGPIIGVQLNNYARKTGDLTVKTKDLVKSGGTDYLSSDEKNQSTDWDYTMSMWENDPDTSSQWTSSGLAAAEFGIEVTAMSTTTTTTTV